MARANSTGGQSSRKDSPIKLHSGGQWFVKRKGRFFYLGRDFDAALKTYLDGKPYFDAGRKPPEVDGRLTVKDLVNRFLGHAEQQVATGELSPATFKDYFRIGTEIVEALGRLAVVEELTPDDFAKLRAKLAKGRNLETLANRITRARVVLRYAEGAELITGRVRFGKSFDRPAKEKLLAAQNARGPRDLSPEQVASLLAKADTVLTCWTLLGLQCAFGPTDLAKLPLSAVDLKAGWIVWPRPKTGVNRRVPIWTETASAIREYLAIRPEPKPEAAGLLFVNRYRNGYSRESVNNAFANLRDACGLSCTHYDLRRTFRTVADATLDGPAIDKIMGHTDSSMGGTYRQRVDDDRLQAVAEHVYGWLYGTPKDSGR